MTHCDSLTLPISNHHHSFLLSVHRGQVQVYAEHLSTLLASAVLIPMRSSTMHLIFFVFATLLPTTVQ